MAGQGKGFVWQDYLTGYQVIWKEGCISIDSHIEWGNDMMDTPMIWNNDMLTSKSDSPERALIKKDLLEKLSTETKEIIKIILDSPNEIMQLFKSKKYNKIHKDRIGQFLIDEKKWERETVHRCFKELAAFSKELQ